MPESKTEPKNTLSSFALYVYCEKKKRYKVSYLLLLLIIIYLYNYLKIGLVHLVYLVNSNVS